MDLRYMKLIKNKFFICLVSIALISGSFWGFVYEKNPRPEFSGSGEAFSYDQKAVSILEQGLFSGALQGGTSERLFYPIFLAGIYKIFGHNYHTVTVVQILLFVLIAILIYRLTRLIFNEKIARIASIIMSLCYSVASFSGWLYREVFFTFLITFLIYSLYKAQKTFKNNWFALSGLVAGLAMLTNSVIQFFIVLIIINFFVVCWPRGFNKILLKISLFFIFLVLMIGPWIISGYFSLGGGGLEGLILRERAEKMESLEDKYLEHFIGNTLGDFFAYKLFEEYNPLEVRHGIETWNKYGQWVDQNKDMVLLNRVFLEEAKEFIYRHPWMYLKQSSIDFLKFNTPMIPNMRMQHVFVETHQELSNLTKGTIIILIRLAYLIFFILITYAIIKNIKYWSKMSWLILIILYFNGIFSAIHAIARYSLPIYPMYIILITIGLIMIWNKIKNKNENLFSNK